MNYLTALILKAGHLFGGLGIKAKILTAVLTVASVSVPTFTLLSILPHPSLPFVIPASNLQPQNPASNFQHQTSIFLFWGLKTYKDVYLFDELKEFNLKICLSRESNLNMILEPDRQYFDLGHVDQVMERQLANYRLQITDYEFYLCGGRNVVESLRQNLLSKNIPQEYIYFEKF